MRFFLIFLTFFSSIILVHAEEYNSTKWVYNVDIDDFSDEEKHFGVILSSDKKGFIGVSCFPNKQFETKISTGSYIGDSASGRAKYRVDKEKPVSTNFNSSDNFMYFNDIDNTFIKDIMSGKEKVLVQLTDYDYDTSKNSYSLTNSTSTIQKVIDACK
jgi:hypothetical protein